MTDDQMQSVRDDIAYVRAVAHEGRNAPILAGPVLVAAAVIFGGATLIQWGMEAGLVGGGDWAPMALWIGVGVVFAGCMIWLVGRMKRQPGFNTSRNRAVGSAWRAVGFGIFATWAGLVAMSIRTDNWIWMAAMPTIVAVAYGSAWLVGAAMTGARWMSWIAFLSYAGAVALGWFAGGAELYLVFAAVLVAVALIPGLILMRQESAGAA